VVVNSNEEAGSSTVLRELVPNVTVDIFSGSMNEKVERAGIDEASAVLYSGLLVLVRSWTRAVVLAMLSLVLAVSGAFVISTAREEPTELALSEVYVLRGLVILDRIADDGFVEGC
jgi:hypothetical protein